VFTAYNVIQKKIYNQF